MTRTGLVAAPFDARVELAAEYLNMVAERDGWITDSDVTDAAAMFTMSTPADENDDDYWVDDSDYRLLKVVLAGRVEA